MKRILFSILALLALSDVAFGQLPPGGSVIVDGVTPITGGSTGQCVTKGSNGKVDLADCGGNLVNPIVTGKLSFATNRSSISSPADGTISLQNNAGGLSALTAGFATFGGTLSGSNSAAVGIVASTNAAKSLNQGVVTQQFATGTITGSYGLNRFKTWSDDIDGTNSGGPDYFVNNALFEHYFGGSTVRGGRQGIATYLYLTAATNSANDNRNYSAFSASGIAQSGDGGTDPTTAPTSKGQIFGGGFVGSALNGATALLNVTAAEFNSAMQTGSSVYAKSIIQLSARTDDAVNGSGIDTMIWLYNQGTTTIKWANGIRFDNGANGTGNFPFNSSSTLFYVGATTGAPTIGTGFDLSGITVSTAAFKSPGFTLDGKGATTVAYGTTATSAPLLNLSQTWNDGGGGAGVFKGATLNFTRTSGDATNSRPFEVLMGGVDTFYVQANGTVHASGRLRTASGGAVEFQTRSIITSTANGTINLFANNGTTLSALNVGLITTGSATLMASSVALTNGAAAQTGTLLNAPTAGNPTKWIPINDNGTTRYIPAW